jgi:hypothetical protein
MNKLEELVPKWLLAMLIVVLLISGTIIGYYFSKTGKIQQLVENFSPTTRYSEDILFLTQPVNTLSGVIEETNNNSLIIKTTPNKELMNGGEDAAEENVNKDQRKQLTYQVLIDDETEIVKEQTQLNYLFKKEEFGFNDLEQGMEVVVQAKDDLRTLAKEEFVAESIRFEPRVQTLEGTIEKVEGNVLHLEKQLIEPGRGDEKTVYQVRVNGETEISAEECNNLQCEAQRYSLTDLRTNTQVTVYTHQMDGIKAEALRIVPEFEMQTETTERPDQETE